ncbi:MULTISPECIES: hypothetical protein [Romboutsia]|uniref:hypothetical protein n=1 Tax=Romboutsia TaxID=1501226 RepID=UPI001411B3A9|nr:MULTISPECIES: hypothetical protein [Romboutsia]MDB8791198.1 hypothetical protein [Romboutsia sp. 1001216sp1]MDB8806701.1 hypothetical protein [Romboutsia sp. 1001216sp1]MDB8812168.1 hypothetical protein [Romboutsia sp. 1001216sp1]MDB8815345.1 hypothetical protein [Romboutsia sp. 1001216sp1]
MQLYILFVYYLAKKNDFWKLYNIYNSKGDFVIAYFIHDTCIGCGTYEPECPVDIHQPME